MGRKLPDALRLLGVPVEKHDDHFGSRTTDEQWLGFIGEKGWCVVTCDTRLLRNQSERKALVDHDVGCFLLSGVASRDRWYRARVIARNWDRIEDLSATENRPFVWKLYLKGAAKQEDLRAR